MAMSKIFYGWWVVLATSLIHLWGAGTFFYSFTAFFNPIVEEFGWSYAATSFAASLRGIEGGIASPLVGLAVDRYGARRLLFLGSILSGLGFIFLSRTHSLWSFYLLFVFLSVGSSRLFPIPGWAAVTNWFVKHRGKALGLLSAAIGMGGMLIYFVNWLIGSCGWRMTMIIIGIGMWVIGIPCSLMVRHSPEPYGFSPDGRASPKPPLKTPEWVDKKKERDPQEYSVSEAMKTHVFWIIAVTMTISGGTVHAVFVHIMPYLINMDFSRQIASLVASLLVFISIVGRFGFGSLTHRINSRYLLALGLLMQTLGLLILFRMQTVWQAMLFVMLFGPGYGGVITLRLTLQAEYFGRKAFGAIQGAIMAIMILGTMTGPFLTGMYFDSYGNYRMVWLIMAIALLVVIPFALKADPTQRMRIFHHRDAEVPEK
jgi:sugar phosphate permease